ncbi:cell division protein FtsA [Tianweitania sp. BSSL-BM11]|uniref:Cell division protein FtsA n=1 Tax=Tianweitania aestuarii TaxID=2814886 RepID=A0ABS5RV36_9HYPH|nr:cell division protein FtsA [Tianweitania aestuarii]MBS9720915.1 cell division protein FtsA [Tianweitania aestuarii]
MSWLGGNSDNSAKRSGIVSVLDIGSHKICCIIAKLKPREESQLLRGRTHRVQVIGIGHQKSRGVKSGVIVDLDRAEQAIRLAVDAAERMAGLTIDSLIVNVSAGRLKSDAATATVNLGGHETDEADVRRVLEAGARQALRHERQVLHTLPVGFLLDTERGIQDPRGMVGDVLGVDMHVLTADTAPLRNLELCINRAHLSVERMVATPYASGLSALVDDEGEMGAACIDIGAGTTSMSVFFSGKMVYASSIPIGGAHVTMDLARGLSTAMDDAERMKVMHGTVMPAAGDDRDLVTVQPIGSEADDGGMQVPRAAMNRIIRARVEETLEIVRDRLNQSGSGHLAGKRVVLTGGGAQLQGLAEAARRILGRNVRVGRPLGVAGLPEAAKGPAFAAAVGLMIYPQVAEFEVGQVAGGVSHRLTGTGGRFGRVGQWLRQSF